MIADKAINTHEKVRDFQNRLYLTAKADRKRKFYAMYDKIYRKDILEEDNTGDGSKPLKNPC